MKIGGKLNCNINCVKSNMMNIIVYDIIPDCTHYIKYIRIELSQVVFP